jgi:hypothetical protein
MFTMLIQSSPTTPTAKKMTVARTLTKKLLILMTTMRLKVQSMTLMKWMRRQMTTWNQTTSPQKKPPRQMM